VPDPRHPFSDRGVGEVPIVPPMAAVANATKPDVPAVHAGAISAMLVTSKSAELQMVDTGRRRSLPKYHYSVGVGLCEESNTKVDGGRPKFLHMAPQRGEVLAGS
jgi:hypothetical protein